MNIKSYAFDAGYSMGFEEGKNMKNDWISVMDDLPEIGIQVLAYGEEPKNIHDDGLPFKTGIYDGKKWISDHFCESSYIEVTHWMPLPSPPDSVNET